MTTHDSLSPSARHRWGVCPGSVREEKAYPKSPSGPAAVDGTHSHSLLEWCLKDPLGSIREPREALGKTLTDHEGEFTVAADRVERVALATKYIRDRVQTHRSMTGGADIQVISERRVHPDSLVGRMDMSGTVDVQIKTVDSLEIIDYKDGMAPVAAKDNPQLLQYAVGAVAEMIDRNESLPATVTMSIIQPKLRMKGLSGVDSHTVTIDELMADKNLLILQAAATDDPAAPLVPGESQCKYCAHKGACSALTTQSLNKAGIVFQNLDVAQQSADKDPSKMTDAQIVEIMEAAPLVRSMLEAVETEAQRRLETGQTIDGIKLVNGRGARAWILDEEEMAERLKKLGLSKSEMYPSKLVSVAEAEKVLKAKAAEKGQDPTKKIKLMEAEYVKKTTGKPTIALASDPRPAIIVNAAPMFEAVDAIPSWLS